MRWPPPPDWPHADLSRQIYCRPHRWHVQETGTGDTLLLLHGAGGSTHSFRDLIRLLSQHYHVIALDLPGQGFTQLGARHRSGLEATANDIIGLCDQEAWHPSALIGHSAGGALALRLSQALLSPQGQPPKVIGINPALDTFKGVAGVLFPALAKVLSAVPFTAQIFASTSRTPQRIEALIRSTGSDIDLAGLSLYQRLIGDRDHADAALIMMAQWSLEGLVADLPDVDATTLFIAGDQDGVVPASVSDKAAARLPKATVVHLPHLGHLAHEEAPEEVTELIRDFLTG
ncbi:alpha/beta fold hydrolase BchO [Roseobacter weihaiensis]|uniref:alpha/beta fold hydrolase BchO n=1 Tax=Roseobacter weihaiensis TaxID=2763262 RepID=UPI001D0ABD45|nr:alpha/beta fold hydrolase BchO [Roseobacter sp. H9]